MNFILTRSGVGGPFYVLYWLMNKETALALIGQNLGRQGKLGRMLGEGKWRRSHHHGSSP